MDHRYCPNCYSDIVRRVATKEAIGFPKGLEVLQCASCSFRWETPVGAKWMKLCTECGQHMEIAHVHAKDVKLSHGEIWTENAPTVEFHGQRQFKFVSFDEEVV